MASIVMSFMRARNCAWVPEGVNWTIPSVLEEDVRIGVAVSPEAIRLELNTLAKRPMADKAVRLAMRAVTAITVMLLRWRTPERYATGVRQRSSITVIAVTALI